MKAHDIATVNPWVPNMENCMCICVCVSVCACAHMHASEYLVKENTTSIDSQDFDL